MTTGQTLLDKAAQVCGSRYALAKQLHVSQAQLSEIANGKEGLSPGLAARLAAVAGDDPRDAALTAVIEKEQQPEKRARLAQLFGMSAEWRRRWLANLRSFALTLQ